MGSGLRLVLFKAQQKTGRGIEAGSCEHLSGIPNISAEEVDGALQFLLALCLLDIGMRVGMATPQSIGTERSSEVGGREAVLILLGGQRSVFC